jgi:hypothetical protein
MKDTKDDTTQSTNRTERARRTAERFRSQTDAELWARWEKLERKRIANDRSPAERAEAAMLRIEMDSRGIGPGAEVARLVTVRDAIAEDLCDAPGALFVATWTGARRVCGIRADSTGVWIHVKGSGPLRASQSIAVTLDERLLYTPNA